MFHRLSIVILILTISISATNLVRFNSFNIVKDLDKNIAYQDSESKLLKMEEAIEYCSNLKIAGLNWKVPTFNELFNIIEQKANYKTVSKVFTNIESDNWYLSLTEHNDIERPFWLIGLANGEVSFLDRKIENSFYVKCVADISNCILDVENITIVEK